MASLMFLLSLIAGVISDFNIAPTVVGLLHAVAGFNTFASIPAFAGIHIVLTLLLLL
jgi:hypothetical protein